MGGLGAAVGVETVAGVGVEEQQLVGIGSRSGLELGFRL